MPTLGWILERQRDFDPDTLRRGPRNWNATPSENVTPGRPCPYCSGTFPTADELADHVGTTHVHAVPRLLAGSSPVADQLAIPLGPLLLPLTPVQCDRILLHGAGTEADQISPERLEERLASLPPGSYRLELRNRHASSEIRVEVHDADPSPLIAVESDFLRVFNREEITNEHLQRFIDDRALAERRAPDRAVRYWDALGSYVLGVYLKDAAARDDSGRMTFRKHFQSALEGLNDVDRPLARVVRTAAGFSFNDFSKASYASPDLDQACGFFAGRVANGPAQGARSDPDKSVESAWLPVDAITRGVLDACVAIEKRGHEVRQRLEELGRRGDLRSVPEDELKVQVLLAECALREGDSASAMGPLRALIHEPRFGRWASERLQQLRR